jgi:phosphoribosylformimino-5-aminoimidazole carboxamide ribonucleotide (ProFAR) isomerase
MRKMSLTSTITRDFSKDNRFSAPFNKLLTKFKRICLRFFQPEFTQAMLKKYGSKIVIGVDAKDEKVAVEGWLEKTETDAFEFCQQLVEFQLIELFI